jgi:integrase/recombinase XerD
MTIILSDMELERRPLAGATTGALVPPSMEALAPLVAGWLLAFGSENTRRAYARDVRAWLNFCLTNDLDPLEARRPHVDAWARALEAQELSSATVARQLSAIASWYSWLVVEEVLDVSPVVHVRRPKVSPESGTLGPDLDEARCLLAAAERLGPKPAALVALLLLNGLRVSEALAADVADLAAERDHQVLRVHRKGGQAAVVPLAPRTVAAIEALTDGRSSGPIFVGEHAHRGATGRLTPSGATYILSRVTQAAGIDKRLSPHSLRHAFVTLSLEAGSPLTDVQDAAGHADPRTTRRYDRARHRLDHAPTYALATMLEDG